MREFQVARGPKMLILLTIETCVFLFPHVNVGEKNGCRNSGGYA
jgi:hypothetical protein